ncbi:hypothetical protein BS50DRAFT_115433 [Corynespora cassiicola Philippines]|uniref:Uncharacterized protein n=1 Tax=Corynespora cassiicola Philippines TaxID=1448308 RepID=A0A2T2NDJ1_CORCC|nr:hypothetical protein BS50DRAFT_115433 [Corynespora cassiicola Philippines]
MPQHSPDRVPPTTFQKLSKKTKSFLTRNFTKSSLSKRFLTRTSQSKSQSQPSRCPSHTRPTSATTPTTPTRSPVNCTTPSACHRPHAINLGHDGWGARNWQSPRSSRYGGSKYDGEANRKRTRGLEEAAEAARMGRNVTFLKEFADEGGHARRRGESAGVDAKGSPRARLRAERRYGDMKGEDGDGRI